MRTMNIRMAKYNMKGVGIPEYYLGDNVEQMGEE